MSILVVEDDENKRGQLVQFLGTLVSGDTVGFERSLQSGVRRVKSERFDVIILDMTLPTYDVSPDEPSNHTNIFGGHEFLRQMDRFDIEIPVVVFTQFEVFGEAPNEITLADLDNKLSSEFSSVYAGIVYYHAAINSWKGELESKLYSIGIL